MACSSLFKCCSALQLFTTEGQLVQPQKNSRKEKQNESEIKKKNSEKKESKAFIKRGKQHEVAVQ